MDIVDLHCDMLAYLQADSTNTPHDPQVRCSSSQLQKGGVRLQVMPIFADTAPGSEHTGYQQYQIFKSLSEQYPSYFKRFGSDDLVTTSSPVTIMLAIENASAVFGDDEPLYLGIDRLTKMQEEVGQILYISLTYNGENRFGGGALTSCGITEDGKRLLQALDDTGIAVDFSHASDRMAHDIIDTIDSLDLNIPVMASHSNMRAVTDCTRNLPDSLAREIIARDGLIGLNFIRHFVGEQGVGNLIRHIDHLFSLGGEYNTCLGADFFHCESFDSSKQYFFDGYDNASCYSKVVDLLRRRLTLTEDTLARITHRNALRRIARYHVETTR